MKRIPFILAAAVCCVGLFMGDGAGQSRNTVLQKAGLSAEARAAILSVGADVKELQKSHDNSVATAKELDGLSIKLLQKAREVSRLAAEAEKAEPARPDKLYRAAREMAEMCQDFDIRHLDLQKRMQDENRRFTLVSNIMRTKHDTAKNAINNVR